MLSLSLAKLSVALDTDPDAHSFTWQHQTHDLTFVIDSYGGSSSSQLLKVVQGTQVRQLIELQRLISEGDDMMRTMQQRGVSLKAEQLPISAIVRCPLLAIRWQLPNQKVRRAQIKFKSSQDYDAAYSKLHQLGLRMTPSTDVRPYTPSTPNGASPVRPGSTAATLNDHALSGGLSCPPSYLAGITSRPFAASESSMSMQAPPSQEATHSRPLSAHAGQAFANPATPGFPSGRIIPPVYFPRPSSATTDLLQQSSITGSCSPTGDSFIPTVENVSQISGARTDFSIPPSSPHNVEVYLPPRRELPFHRSSTPLSSGSDTVRPPSRPSTSLMGPPPLPMRVASLRPSSARDGALEIELPRLPQPTVLVKPESRQVASQKPPRTPDTSPAVRPGMSSVSQVDIESQRPSSSSPTNSTTGSSPSLLRRANSAFSPTGFSNPPQSVIYGSRRSTSLNNPATPPTSDAMPHDRIVPSASQAVDGSDTDGLRVYVMQSEDGRRAALDEFIFRHLENDDFLTLLEDMETCWARVALGMR